MAYLNVFFPFIKMIHASKSLNVTLHPCLI